MTNQVVAVMLCKLTDGIKQCKWSLASSTRKEGPLPGHFRIPANACIRKNRVYAQRFAPARFLIGLCEV